jgi:hypothetical protein
MTAERVPISFHEITRLLMECLSDEPDPRQVARRKFQAEYSMACPT